MTKDTKMMENSTPPGETPAEPDQNSPALGDTVQGMSLAFSTRVTTKMENLLERLDELLEIEARLAEAEPPVAGSGDAS